MRCQACEADVPESAQFCPACGAKLGSAPSARSDSSNRGEADPGAGLRAMRGRRDDPEEELWTGGYSSKAMLGTFIGVALLSLGLIVLGVLVPPTLLFALGGMVLLWLYALAVLAFRRLNIAYRLTTQRFFHQHGILTRTTDRVEVIQMSDVTYTQTVFERLFGVGTITIKSSDVTHPVLTMPGIADVAQVAETIDKARRRELTRRGLRIESL
jgi:membrane protein YdbS with pleckstrin-like domain